MEWYQKTSDEVLKQLGTNRDGLSKEAAGAALAKYGPNQLEEGEKESALQIFLGQFRDLLVIILIIAAGISALTGDAKSTLVIITVLILNAALGTLQEVKAQKSLDSLKSLTSPHVKVFRDGQKIEIDSKELVPGDIVLAEAGDVIAADGRIIENYSLQVGESALTGESTNVDKKEVVLEGEVPLADRVNMVYSGSLVTYGRALVCVTGTGMKTEIGKIAALMNETKEKKTPLQVSLDKFSASLATGILIISALVMGLEIFRGMTILDSLLFAVALAVAAIPEALGSIVTIVQAMGTQKMTRENAIIRNLSAVEALGSVSVICSDKTGTLTQNKMTVQDIYVGGKVLQAEELDLSRRLHRYLLYDAVLTNDSSFSEGKGIGDPTEYALLEMYKSIGEKAQKEEGFDLTHEDLREVLSRVDELPFDSDRKLMSTKHIIHGRPTIFIKGAPDVLLERCDYIQDKDEAPAKGPDESGARGAAKASAVRPMAEEDRMAILSQIQKFSENGLRVLAFGYKESDEDLTPEAEQHFTFLGLISEMDPAREESVTAVKHAAEAGIRTVMITGDHKVTATAIARQIGIFKEGDLAVTGLELDAMSDEELTDKIEKISVYARVSPENKIRIVRAWQAKGRIVSMTGDGVNDAPALKQADIGVAMGITGTEVSKDAASMVLADDNFATIIKAVANGRTVYTNIKNAVLYLLSGNLSAIIAVLFTSLAALPVPFEAVQLLFINLVTDSLPALAIGMEPEGENVLKHKPRDPKERLMDRDFIRKMILQGAVIAAAVIAAYLLGLKESELMAASMAFSTLTLARLLHGFNCRGENSIFRLGFKRNWYSLGACVIGFLLVILALLTPFGRSLFDVAVMNKAQIGQIMGLALLPTVIIQVVKLLREKR